MNSRARESRARAPDREHQKRWRGGLFTMCGGIVLLAAWLSPTTDATFLGGSALPRLCVVRSLTGLDCPTCGGTRSFAFALRGDLRKGWAMNRVAPFALLATIGLGVYCGLARVLDPRGRISWRTERRVFSMLLVALGTAFFINWILRLCGV